MCVVISDISFAVLGMFRCFWPRKHYFLLFSTYCAISNCSGMSLWIPHLTRSLPYLFFIRLAVGNGQIFSSVNIHYSDGAASITPSEINGVSPGKLAFAYSVAAVIFKGRPVTQDDLN